MTERGTVEALIEAWAEGVTIRYSKDQFETIVKAIRLELELERAALKEDMTEALELLIDAQPNALTIPPAQWQKRRTAIRARLVAQSGQVNAALVGERTAGIDVQRLTHALHNLRGPGLWLWMERSGDYDLQENRTTSDVFAAAIAAEYARLLDEVWR